MYKQQRFLPNYLHYNFHKIHKWASAVHITLLPDPTLYLKWREWFPRRWRGNCGKWREMKRKWRMIHENWSFQMLRGIYVIQKKWIELQKCLTTLSWTIQADLYVTYMSQKMYCIVEWGKQYWWKNVNKYVILGKIDMHIFFELIVFHSRRFASFLLEIQWKTEFTLMF